MSSSSSSSGGSVHECVVCYVAYNNQANKPRILTACGHTVCDECTITLRQKEDDLTYVVTCPLCRKVTRHDVKESLPMNVALWQLIDDARPKSIVAPTPPPPLAGVRHCDSCIAENAVYGCLQCTENYCTTCWDASHSGGKRSQHQRDVVMDFAKVMCSRHEKMIIDMYCVENSCKVENKLCCPLCAELSSHKGHRLLPIATLSEQHRKVLRVVNDHVTQLIACDRASIDKITKRNNEWATPMVRLKRARAKSRINAIAAEKINALNTWKKARMQAIEDNVDAKFVAYKEKKKETKESIKNMTIVVEQISEVLRCQDPYRIIATYEALEERIKLIDESSGLVAETEATLDGLCRDLGTCNYTWSITEFSTRKKLVRSPVWTAPDGSEWQILLYPKGNGLTGEDKNKWVSIYLESRVDFTSTEQYVYPCMFHFAVESRHATGKAIAYAPDTAIFSSRTKDRGYHRFIHLDELNKFASDFLPNDTLTIELSIYPDSLVY